MENTDSWLLSLGHKEVLKRPSFIKYPVQQEREFPGVCTNLRLRPKSISLQSWYFVGSSDVEGCVHSCCMEAAHLLHHHGALKIDPIVHLLEKNTLFVFRSPGNVGV